MEKSVRQSSGEICLVCEERCTKGIHICERFICYDCERKVIETDTSHANYQYYLEKLRKLRLSRLA
ncbi:sigma factor G inhibitor Gin [Guptibacillus algicola]|uniref:sigma factor G inhibitor Gin n=1 Tax=Guptibacillus algicola TaxID=225844 RepID=UPI001CD43D2B|nr:sigma factor G inhibitor Gin [Alkalihalobacillus algicola]MCA0989590.1 sigma factor G inhibitor Gin [Alkalihalobacillus algicola]